MCFVLGLGVWLVVGCFAVLGDVCMCRWWGWWHKSFVLVFRMVEVWVILGLGGLCGFGLGGFCVVVRRWVVWVVGVGL